MYLNSMRNLMYLTKGTVPKSYTSTNKSSHLTSITSNYLTKEPILGHVQLLHTRPCSHPCRMAHVVMWKGPTSIKKIRSSLSSPFHSLFLCMFVNVSLSMPQCEPTNFQQWDHAFSLDDVKSSSFCKLRQMDIESLFEFILSPST